MGLDSWREEVARFVEAHLPLPPARVLDVGCGDGWLCGRLAGAGYVARGIDPEAPEGELFFRVGLEDYKDREPFDAVVAVVSLHHIADVGAAVAKLADLLRPGGVLAVQEFAWDRFDDATVEWILERLPNAPSDNGWLDRRCRELRERLVRGEPLQAAEAFRLWAAGEGFHSSTTMRRRCAPASPSVSSSGLRTCIPSWRPSRAPRSKLLSMRT